MDGCSSLLQRSFIVARITCGLIGQDIRRLVIELEGLEIAFSSLQSNRARRTRDCVLDLAERLASKEKNCQAEFRPVLWRGRLTLALQRFLDFSPFHSYQSIGTRCSSALTLTLLAASRGHVAAHLDEAG